MTDRELVKFVSEFLDGKNSPGTSRGMCAAICEPLSSLLELCGVPNEVVVSDHECLPDSEWMDHVWLRLADGRALDPTADQFGYAPVYLGDPLPIHGPEKSPVSP